MVSQDKKVEPAFWPWAAAIAFLCLILFWAQPLFARDRHYTSYSDSPETFLRAIESYKRAPHSACAFGDKKPRAGILPHHFLASSMMVDFFECFAAQGSPKRIILIGPDHYSKGIYSASFSSLPWKTPFGMISADADAVGNMRRAISVKEDAGAFSGEHSVGILIPFVKQYFPEARIVPILVRNHVSRPDMLKLAEQLKRYAKDPGTVILLSMDFSHDKTPKEADKMDERSKAVIQGLDIGRIKDVDADNRPGLFMLMKFLKDSGIDSVYFREHSNAAIIAGRPDLKSVTSYFTVFFLK